MKLIDIAILGDCRAKEKKNKKVRIIQGSYCKIVEGEKVLVVTGDTKDGTPSNNKHFKSTIDVGNLL